MAHALNSTNSRYTDICDEPVEKLLSPISGHQYQPLVSLEKAVEPIDHLFNDLQDYVLVAKHNCRDPADGLTQDESAARERPLRTSSGKRAFFDLFSFFLDFDDTSAHP
ncbi:unnamed protein product [Didymodactylos carnosus]|uniref:Uncharacterized protein n=2 Tax=Didymodactylos carnosus TaxID=1234261 RepID=A0A8S2U577_9BILA|nr:unnamed protein product [Didymodactylos carnosus]CAF4323382.1 unnamed protein product [Didymodactylos carnosus]